MELTRNSFRGMRITVMGLGLLGRGVGDVRYLARSGAELIVTDLKSYEELGESVKQLVEFSNIQFVLGEHRLEDFRDRDLILKAAGVPLDSPYIAEAKKHSVSVRMSADLFMEISGVPTIGITGTRGKSTVTHMVHSIFESAGKPSVLGGNVRGVSTLALLDEVTPAHTAILELDSWQCQGFGEAHMSPHIAVCTTFFPDHLGYYKNNLDRYLADKAFIFLNQTEKDILILGQQVADIVLNKYESDIISKVIIVGEKDIPDDWQLSILGRHNRYNAALARAIARASAIDDDTIRHTLENFKGVPGRLELIGEKNSVQYYNDTTATTPEATLAALAALSNEGFRKPLINEGFTKPLILIMGGADKGLSMEALSKEIKTRVKHLVLLSGTGTDTICSQFPTATVHANLPTALDDAISHASPNDIILFSPAFASFGMFKNEFDRGDQFNALVQSHSV